MNQDAQHIDCRGQQCPQPILTTAKAARVLQQSGGGLLEINADDGAFPMDLQSWCRSSGSEIMDMRSDAQGVHRALIRVHSNGRKPMPSAQAPLATRDTVPIVRKPTAEQSDVLDCRGLQCPQPILQIAKRARTQTTGSFEVLADDPAFRLDLDSWGRTSKNQIEWLEQGDVAKARVHLSAPPPVPVAPLPQKIQTVSSPAPSLAPATPVDDGRFSLDVSLTSLDDPQRIARLEAIGASLSPGERIRIRCAGTSFTTPLLRWAAGSGHEVLTFDARTDTLMELRAGEPSSLPATVASSEALQVIKTENRCTLLVLHNDKEALLAALLVAVGAAAQGMEVVMFFTFWGLNLLRGDEPNTAQPKEDVSWMQRMMKWMMPKGPRRQKLGQMDMAGMGRGMLKSIMDKKKIMDIPELMDVAEEQGVQFIACTMSMQVMGITKRDLAPRKNIVYGGVAAFVESAGKSSLSLLF